MDTIKNVIDNAAKGQDFYLLLGDFLDEFYRADEPIQRAMISAKPAVSLPGMLPYAAAAVHKLANDFNLAVPSWVFEKHCYSEKPFFGCNAKGNLRLLFMYQSPTEFKHRNLFVDANVLTRV
ncbi:MAG: hypothetical protein FWH26_09325 [Oscillospiraceae bacterium]|nr:hypothetical protein [Oscillospiraceae bacterium]